MKEFVNYTDEQIIDLTEKFFEVRIRPKVIPGLDSEQVRDRRVNSPDGRSSKRKPGKGWIDVCAKDSPL